MGCPFHDSNDATAAERASRRGPEDRDGGRASNEGGGGRTPDERGIDRREFMKSALAIGGTSALTTAVGLYGMPTAAAAEPVGVAQRNNRQHGWDAFEAQARGTSVPPPHHLVLMLDYRGGGEPSPGHRRKVAGALDSLEEAFGWHHQGLLFTIGYSASYFDRFDEDLPYGIAPEGGAGLMRPEQTIAETAMPHEDPVADDHDACLHLASDHVQNLLAAEAALWGEKREVNGVRFQHTLEGAFTKPETYPERRTGFAGHESVQENLEADTDFDADRIPDESALSMGFDPLYGNSVPRETNASIVEDQKLVEPKPPGMFAQGTIAHVSKLDIDLDLWYDHHDQDGRRERMFSPHHTADDVGVAGENLGESNATADAPTRNPDAEGRDVAERTQADAEAGRPVGHVQKTARARFDLEERLTDDADGSPTEERDDDFRGHDTQELETVMLRRDVDSTDGGTPGMHFVALMRFNGYMSYVRQAMNGVEFDTAAFGLDGEARIDHDHVEVRDQDDGIVNYLTTRHRGNFLLPPITVRALPYPRAVEADLSVRRRGDAFVVEVGLDRGRLDLDTVRFGHYRAVNRGGGARPTDVSRRRGTFAVEFPADGTGLADGGRARLFGKRRGDRRPVTGTVEL